MHEIQVMNRILLASMLVLCSIASAQVGGFQPPYNPDAQPDGFIGAADIVELLTFYGQSFTPDGIYVNDDSTHVLMNMGSMSYPECEYTCQFTLPGSWRLSTLADLGAAWQEAKGAHAWISLDKEFADATYGSLQAWHADNNQYDKGVAWDDLNAVNGCFCSTHERPKMEFSRCAGSSSIVEDCCQLKVQDGWYPLGNSSVTDGGQYVTHVQAFWRWAE